MPNNNDQNPDQPLKLLVVDHSGEPGGGQLGLLRYLKQASLFERSVLLLEGGRLVERLSSTGVPVEVLNGGGGKFAALGKIGKVRKFIRLSRPDIILSNSLRSGIVVSLLVGVKATRIYYLREGLSYGEISGPKRTLVLRFLLPQFEGFLANSEWTAATLPQWLRKRKPVEIAYPISGIQPDQEDVGRVRHEDVERIPSSLGILFLGRLAPWKGVHVLIAAAAELANRGLADKFHVTIVGGPVFADPGYETRLHEKAEISAASIDFTGHVSDISAQLAQHEVLAHCSVDPEPFGQVIVQGMNAGLVVVATRGGGPSEIIDDGITGILVSANDVTELANQLETLIIDRELVASISTKGKMAAKSYSDAKMAAMYESGLTRIHSTARR